MTWGGGGDLEIIGHRRITPLLGAVLMGGQENTRVHVT